MIIKIELAPSWADEFFTGLKDMYGKDKIKYLPSDNPSVKVTLEILET